MRVSSRLVVVATAGLMLGLTATGSQAATVIDPLVGNEGFLVLVEQDAQFWAHEVEGTVAVGGDLLVGGNFTTLTQSTNPFTIPGDGAPTALIVNGKVDLANSTAGVEMHVTGGGYMKIGDLSGVVVRDTDNNNASALTRLVPADDYNAKPDVEVAVHQPASSVGPTVPLDVAGLFPTYRSISTQLATICPENVTPTNSAGNPLTSPYAPGTRAFVTLTPGEANIWNVSAADLNNVTELTFTNQPTADTPLIVNVDTTGVGGDFAWDSPTLPGVDSLQAPYILWNFPDATSLQHVGGDSLEGTLYAPRADFVDLDPSNIEGAVVVKSLVMGSGRVDGGEVHLFPFAATIECEDVSPTPSPTISGSIIPGPTPSHFPTPSGSVTPSSSGPIPSGSSSSEPVPSPSGPTLPDTGQPVVYIGATSLGLLMAGAAFLIVGRRRRDWSR
ncbi:choice-of-anchor A domain-containing protein/LPXTG-motif cell wall-anchored protein [Hamadaea flava]|uniref:Collagen-binding domain-containing protein n=1 Tax=Hamadaea flava TaxID=1742688 RepID=A0ABV8LR70_9ACTN|nr:collagen-binding domain-containing protein [Hamadaea flava]MCP2322647.1 choice-of-anchor A domain-containing protein/LPXTG-motif cell wall-anchored protein [Hamadaea flava]